MVQYCKILVASAVAAVVPALAAPFPYVGSWEIENIDAREPSFRKAAGDTFTYPIQMVTDMIVKTQKAQERTRESDLSQTFALAKKQHQLDQAREAETKLTKAREAEARAREGKLALKASRDALGVMREATRKH